VAAGKQPASGRGRCRPHVARGAYCHRLRKKKTARGSPRKKNEAVGKKAGDRILQARDQEKTDYWKGEENKLPRDIVPHSLTKKGRTEGLSVQEIIKRKMDKRPCDSKKERRTPMKGGNKSLVETRDFPQGPPRKGKVVPLGKGNSRKRRLSNFDLREECPVDAVERCSDEGGGGRTLHFKGELRLREKKKLSSRGKKSRSDCQMAPRQTG